jgi:hypothetical protein
MRKHLLALTCATGVPRVYDCVTNATQDITDHAEAFARSG